MSERVPFVKMSGAGNDFIVLGPEEAALVGGDVATWARRVCRRGVAVGADGVLVVAQAGAGTIEVRFLNPDGGEAFCGNGTRCAARFAVERGWAPPHLVLRTAIGDVPAEVGAGAVSLRLPPPHDAGAREIEVQGSVLLVRCVQAGVPHAVIEVPDVHAAPLARWGPALRRHDAFGPQGTNVDVLSRTSDGEILVRTWERGVEGETLSCGSGAVAAALVALAGTGRTHVRVVPASRIPLEVTIPGLPDAPEAAILVGDARIVFEGILDPEATAGFP